MKKRSRLLLLALAAVLMTGCKAADKTSEINTDNNRIYVNREHNISSSLVYTSETEGGAYSQDELKTYVEAAVAAYNEAKGAGSGTQNAEGAAALPVSLKSCTIDGSTGKVVFDYASGDDLAAFAQQTGDDSHTATGLVTGGVTDAGASDALGGGSFKKPDGAAATLDAIVKEQELSYVVLDGAGTVQTQGPIAYVSDEGVELLDEFTAQVSEGTHVIIFK